MLCDSAGQSSQLLCGMYESQQTTNSFNGGVPLLFETLFVTRQNQIREGLKLIERKTANLQNAWQVINTRT